MTAGERTRSPLADERIYEVFARKRRADRFEHVGTVTAPNPALARVYAWQTYDEQKWFEMTVAPRDAFVPVNRHQAPFTLGGPPPVGEGSAADTDAPPGYGVPSG
ncbi:MAG: hypothetical protein ACE5HQ_02515 [Gemmatimonadota bacterium]